MQNWIITFVIKILQWLFMTQKIKVKIFNVSWKVSHSLISSHFPILLIPALHHYPFSLLECIISGFSVGNPVFHSLYLVYTHLSIRRVCRNLPPGKSFPRISRLVHISWLYTLTIHFSNYLINICVPHYTRNCREAVFWTYSCFSQGVSQSLAILFSAPQWHGDWNKDLNFIISLDIEWLLWGLAANLLCERENINVLQHVIYLAYSTHVFPLLFLF